MKGFLKVTVLLPVFNSEKYLRQAIDSILNQTFKNFELLIINDGSTDGSNIIINSYSDERIRVLDNCENVGLTASRNRGLQEARGEYVALLDSDDIAYSTRLYDQVTFLEKNKDFGLIASWANIIDETSNTTGEIWKYDASPEKIISILLFHNYFVQSAVMLRKSCLPAECYRNFQLAEDYDFWVRIARNTRVWNLQKVLIGYRIHKESISRKKTDLMEECTRNIVTYQLEAIKIKPTIYELELHRCLGLNVFKNDISFVENIESWLMHVRFSNEISRCYEQKFFEETLAEYWFSVCNAATGLGFWTLNKYFKSSLSSNSAVSMKKISGFIFNCIFNRQRIT